MTDDELREGRERLQEDVTAFTIYQEQARVSGDNVGATVFSYLALAYSNPGKAPMRRS
ncbi:MAG: hypothetical protein AAB892_00100 [Patescibacteria group bacterium]